MVRQIAVLVLVMTAVVGVVGAEESWSDRTRAAEWAFSRGDFDRAEAEFRAALEIAQQLPEGDRRLETSLENLGLFFEHQMRMDEAQPVYLLLLAAQEHRVGDSDPVLLGTLFAVARASIPTGDTPTARESLQRYVDIADATGAAKPDQHWRVLSLYARIETLVEEPDRALQLQRSAVAVLRSDPGATELERASEIESLAQMETLHGTAEGVEALLVESVELRRADGAGGAAEVYAGAASTALGAGEPELAERLAAKALSETAEGESEPVEAHRVLADAAWMKVRRGSGEIRDLMAVEAEPALLQDAAVKNETLLELREAQWATDDPDRIEILSRLAMIATMKRELDRAAHWQRLRAEALSTAGGDPLIQATDGLAFLLTENGSWQDALDVNTELLTDLEAMWGERDPRLAPVIERQITLLTELGRKKEAKPLRKQLRKLGV
jgi:tetratricopeptide (TPR) repeat protein